MTPIERAAPYKVDLYEDDGTPCGVRQGSYSGVVRTMVTERRRKWWQFWKPKVWQEIEMSGEAWQAMIGAALEEG